MPVDLNAVREKLKRQKPVGLTRDGKLSDKDPGNDGTKPDSNGQTTLQPQRFFA